MTCTLHVAWDDRLSGYDFGPGHPMAPLRLKLTMELAQAFGLGRQDGVAIWYGRSARRYWSASTGATRTGATRWPTWS